MGGSFRVVLDTNILLRGMLNIRSAAGRVVRACEERAVVLLLSKPVLAEYRTVLTDRSIVERYPELTFDKVERFAIAVCCGPRWRPSMLNSSTHVIRKDEMFVELAIEGMRHTSSVPIKISYLCRMGVGRLRSDSDNSANNPNRRRDEFSH